MLDIGMIALFIVLMLVVLGIGLWADKVVDEGSGQS